MDFEDSKTNQVVNQKKEQLAEQQILSEQLQKLIVDNPLNFKSQKKLMKQLKREQKEKNKKFKNKPDFEKLILESGLQQQHQKLKEQGYEEAKKNYKLLFCADGNYEKVLQIYKQKDQKKAMRLLKKKGLLDNFAQYQEQLKALQSEGFDNQKACLKALNKCQGDLNEARKSLVEKSQKKQKKKQLIENALIQFQEKLQLMEAKGFENNKKNIKWLLKVKGNTEKAMKILSQQNNKQMTPEQRLLRQRDVMRTNDLRIEQFPQTIEKLYLDGNNFFYSHQYIRDLMVRQNKGKQTAELVIVEVSKCLLFKIKSLKEVVLVFDNTNLFCDETLNTEDGNKKFVCLSARPKYQSSDDFLVDQAEKETIDQAKIVYCTSDVGLTIRLMNNAKAKYVMKSGAFFKEMIRLISEEAFINICKSNSEKNQKNI